MKRTILILLFLFLLFDLKAQKLTLDGYVKDMEGIYLFDDAIPISFDKEIKTVSYNLIHNRLNFKLYPVKNLVVDLELRNRLFSGKLVGQMPGYADAIAVDNGLVDLSWNIAKEKKYFLNTSIDRFFIDYTLKNWQIRDRTATLTGASIPVWNQRHFSMPFRTWTLTMKNARKRCSPDHGIRRFISVYYRHTKRQN